MAIDLIGRRLEQFPGIKFLEMARDIATNALAVVTAMIFGAYAGFGVAHASARGNLVELAFIAVGLCLVGAGLQFGRPWIAAALLAHGTWDVAHHPRRRFGAPVRAGLVPAVLRDL